MIFKTPKGEVLIERLFIMETLTLKENRIEKFNHGGVILIENDPKDV